MLSLLFSFLLGVLAVVAFDRLRSWRGAPAPEPSALSQSSNCDDDSDTDDVLDPSEWHDNGFESEMDTAESPPASPPPVQHDEELPLYDLLERKYPDVDRDPSLISARNKQGVVWLLEAEKVSKINPDDTLYINKMDFVDVCPVKRFAKIKDCSLILSDFNDTYMTTIALLEYAVAAVSASDHPTHKWAKNYPIKLESKKFDVYKGSRALYLYLENPLEKESWCKALRLAACTDKERLQFYAQSKEEFQNYLGLLNADQIPSYQKSSELSVNGETSSKSNKSSGSSSSSSSKMRHFLKKLAKRTPKSAAESRTSTSSSTLGVGDKKADESLQENGQPTSPTSVNKSKTTVQSDAPCDDSNLCWNLLFSRLFFDAKRSLDVNNLIKSHIEGLLSNVKTPIHICGVRCASLNLGNHPPYIHNMKVLPTDLNEMWAMEVDVEYSGGMSFEVEIKLEVCDPEVDDEGIDNRKQETCATGEAMPDLADGPKKSKASSLTCMSRSNSIMCSFGKQFSQVPLSVTIKLTSFQGTLHFQINPPPSDQLWFGFTSMPKIDWNLEATAGNQKISNSTIVSLIDNQFKAAIYEALVLPNCDSICIPWMLAEKDDWIPRMVAPFRWTGLQTGETRMKIDGKTGSGTGFPSVKLDETVSVNEIKANRISQSSQTTPFSSTRSSQFHITDAADQVHSPSRMDSPYISSRAIVPYDEQRIVPCKEEDEKKKKLMKKSKMIGFGMKMGAKLEETRRNAGKKGRNIVGKMLEKNSKHLNSL